MTKQRNFTTELKAKVAFAVLRCDRTTQEIASRYKVNPNQVSSWLRQSLEGNVFLNVVNEARHEREAEVKVIRDQCPQ